MTMSSPPALVWTSWSSMNSLPKGAPSCWVVFGPRSSFQIRNLGQEVHSFDAVAAGSKVVLHKMNFGLDNGEFVMEVSELIVGASVTFNFSQRIPVVKVGNGTTEGV